MAFGEGFRRAGAGFAQGVARASMNWPADRERRAQRVLAEYQVDQQRVQSQANMLLKAANQSQEMAKMFAETGDYTGASRALKEYLKYNENFRSLLASQDITDSIYDTPGAKFSGATLPGVSKAESVEPTEPTEPTEPDRRGLAFQYPRKTQQEATPALESISTTDSGIDTWVSGLADKKHRADHTESVKLLEETAVNFGWEVALSIYTQAVPSTHPQEYRDKAKVLFKQMAEGTTDKRRGAIERLWKEAFTRVSSQKSLARYEWRNFIETTRKYGGLEEDEYKAKFEAMHKADYAIKASAEMLKDLGRGGAIIESATRAMGLLNDTYIKENMGGWQGAKAQIRDRLIGWELNKEWSLTEDQATKMRDMINTLGGTVDMFSRMQSGAALTPSEVAFYGALIGSIGQPGYMVKQNMKNLIKQLSSMRTNLYREFYRSRVGMQPLGEKVMYGGKEAPTYDIEDYNPKVEGVGIKRQDVEGTDYIRETILNQ